MRGWVLVGLIPCATQPAWAASFSCANASTQVETTICANKPLSAADETLTRLYQQVLSEAAAPGTVRADQKRWLTGVRDKADGADALKEAYDQRILALNAILHPPRPDPTPAPPGTVCWKANDAAADAEPCQVESAGTVPDAPGPVPRFQIQVRHDASDPPILEKRLIVEIPAADGGTIRLADLSDGDSYDAPLVVHGKDGTLLCLTGNISGTGALMDTALFVWRDGHWNKVDHEAWIAQLPVKLGRPVTIQRGPWPDWGRLTVETNLWKPTDGGCCGTGGRVKVWLKLDHDKIVIDHLMPLPPEDE